MTQAVALCVLALVCSVTAQSCVGTDVMLSAPLLGTASRRGHATLTPMSVSCPSDFVVTTYVDVDPSSPGYTDWSAGNRTFDASTATEFTLSSFRAMDYDGTPVLAASDGTVTAINHMSGSSRSAAAARCPGSDNQITITAANGFKQTYHHLRASSALVTVGQSVSRGDAIALVGASGCVPSPRVGFEVRDCANAVVDPYSASLWLAPFPYDMLSNAMELSLLRGTVTDEDDLSNYAGSHHHRWTFTQGDQMTLVYVHSNSGATADVSIAIKRPGQPDWTQDLLNRPACLHCTVSITPFSAQPNGMDIGIGTVEVRLNSAILLSRSYEVTATGQCDTLCDFCNQKTTYFVDRDGDSYGSRNATVDACIEPAGYAAKDGDCDDANAAVHPAATETCNGIDDDCDATIDMESCTRSLPPGAIVGIAVGALAGVAVLSGAAVYGYRQHQQHISQQDGKDDGPIAVSSDTKAKGNLLASSRQRRAKASAAHGSAAGSLISRIPDA